MAGLWDPPDNQEIEDTRCEIDGCQCAFCLANDVVEETTLNEISCIEVLRIMISKTDTDIIELEDELLDLLSQLLCTDEEFSNMLTMCLRRQITSLDLSIRKLKNDAGDFLSTTSRTPPENMLDILKSLFSRFIQKKDKQFADSTKNITTSSCQVHSDIPYGEKKQTPSSSKANQIEKNKRIINTSSEKHKISQSRVIKTEVEEHADYHYTQLFSMEKWQHQLVKVKSQSDEESIGSKSTSPNTQIVSYRNSNPDDLQEPNVSICVSPNKRRQIHSSPLQTIPSSRSPYLLLEGADVASKCSELDNDYYTVGELRAIARQRGLKGYSKFRKMELAHALGINIVEGKRKQKRKETLSLALIEFES